MANFCSYCQRYQSLATVRISILPVSLEKQIWHVLVAMVVRQEFVLAERATPKPLINLAIRPISAVAWLARTVSMTSYSAWVLPYQAFRFSTWILAPIGRCRSEGTRADGEAHGPNCSHIDYCIRYLGVSERQLVNAVERLAADGKYELAASLLESAGDRFDGSSSVGSAKRLVYLKLMEEHQNTDPFKFIIYSGKIGEQTPQMTAPKGGVARRP
jgi:hypothetical protein